MQAPHASERIYGPVGLALLAGTCSYAVNALAANRNRNKYCKPLELMLVGCSVIPSQIVASFPGHHVWEESCPGPMTTVLETWTGLHLPQPPAATPLTRPLICSHHPVCFPRMVSMCITHAESMMHFLLKKRGSIGQAEPEIAHLLSMPGVTVGLSRTPPLLFPVALA